jgi:uncharacterized protein
MNNFELRDPVHKRITFNSFEKGIIDHPFVQRLRHISQLGLLTSFVFPGAVHNRFEHCLGTMHVAGRLFGRFVTSSNVVRDNLSQAEIEALGQRLRIAGLLHDIGHGPFSHSSETVFPLFKDLPMDWSWWKVEPTDRQAHHEDYSVLLVQTLSKEGVLEKDFAQDVASLIDGGVKPSKFFESIIEKLPSIHKILKGLVSGEVDCDRMDYLLRDSYYCGVAYGHYDIDWLISAMAVTELNGELVFSLSENGMRAFEDFLLARFHMTDQVYFHKTKAGLTHYLEEAIKTKEINLEIPTDPYEYTNLRDGAVVEMLFGAAKDEKNYWSRMLMSRLPAKRVLRFDNGKDSDMKDLELITKRCDDAGIKYFTHSARNKFTDLDEDKKGNQPLFVKKKTLNGNEFVPIFEYSKLLRNYNNKINVTDFFVHREDAQKYLDL